MSEYILASNERLRGNFGKSKHASKRVRLHFLKSLCMEQPQKPKLVYDTLDLVYKKPKKYHEFDYAMYLTE